MGVILQCTWRLYEPRGWEKCPSKATMCLVYGCQDGHMNETVYCDCHFNTWMCLDVTCGKCAKTITDWESTSVRNLTAGFALYMRTRQ